MKQWFEDGRLPCSLSPQLLWEPIVAQLDRFDHILDNKKNAITSKQQEKEEASQEAQNTRKEMEKLRCQLDGFEEKERSLAEQEKALRIELEALYELDIDGIRVFAQSAAQVEKDVVSQLEAQLAEDREGLFALNEKESPKLGLLLNCFGAEAGTIQSLPDLNSEDLIWGADEDVESMVSGLPRDQQIVVLFTQDRLKEGTVPLGDHDCAVCNCRTVEEMASFCGKHGLSSVTEDVIRKTGASLRSTSNR